MRTVASVEQLLEDEHVLATKLVAELPAADGSKYRFVGVPVLFDGERPPVLPPPRLGEHTQAVVATLRASRHQDTAHALNGLTSARPAAEPSAS